MDASTGTAPGAREPRRDAHRAHPRALVYLSDGAYLVTRDDKLTKMPTWVLMPCGPLSNRRSLIFVCECADPEAGSPLADLLGLACSCPGPNAPPSHDCSHLRELVALGLLRPAPDWSLVAEAEARYAVAGELPG